MTDQNSFRGLLHAAMHRVPGVPQHADRPAGHQGATRRNRPRNPGRNHATTRQPRVLVAWQRRIAAVFGQEL